MLSFLQRMRPFSKSLPFALLALAGFSEAAVVTQQWTLGNEDISPDGFTRSAALVNGQYPGPLLSFNKGDTAYVTVNNRLSDPTMRRSSSIVSPCPSLPSFGSNPGSCISRLALAWYCMCKLYSLRSGGLTFFHPSSNTVMQSKSIMFNDSPS